MNNSINQSLINNTVQKVSPEIDLTIETMPTLQDLINFKDGIINIINDMLRVLTSGHPVYLVVVISILIAFVLKKKYNENYIFAIFIAGVIFGFFRFLGIGN